MKEKNSAAAVVCKGCGKFVAPINLREPSVFAKGIQIKGKFYRACPECLHDVSTGKDRQVIDIEAAREEQAAVDIIAFFQDARETFYAIAIALGIVVALAIVFYIAISAVDLYDALIYWFKGTKLGFWYYTNLIK